MIKRSRANRTERATFRNIRNEHKFIDVVHHGDGHYYMIQYIKHELPERTVVNYMGTRCGHKQKFRIGKATLMGILEDYKKVEEDKAMMKHEFEERVGGEISDQNYEIIETVYTWHPAINEVGGKDQIATLYETGGMPLIKSMLEAANIMMDLDKERRQAMRRMEEIRRRIETVASGDLTEEQCRRDAVGMFDKSNTPEEWGYARMFLATKYGEELASEIIEEVEK